MVSCRALIKPSYLKALLLVMSTVASALLLPGPAPLAQAQSNDGSSVTIQSTGAIITVDTTADESTANDGTCSLREAIANANNNNQTSSPDCPPGSATIQDSIVFANGISGPITLNSTLPGITDPKGLTIDGGNAPITLIASGDPLVGGTIFFVTTNGKLSLRNLTLTSGNAGGSGGGGGGVDNEGTLEVNNSTFSNNQATLGGAIFNGGTLTVNNSTFSGNSANTAGGAIDNVGKLTVTNTTLTGNGTTGHGAGISNQGVLADATLQNTIVAKNTPGDNCSLVGAPFPSNGKPITDGGYNIDDDNTCGFSQANNSKPNTDPQLDPNGLQDNGGPTKTIALQPTSPTIDQGNSFGSTTDQRGKPRPMDFPGVQNAPGGDGSDIGAFELEQLPAPPPPPRKHHHKHRHHKHHRGG